MVDWRRTDSCGRKKWEQSGRPRGAVQVSGDIEGPQPLQEAGGLGKRKTLSPGADGPRAGVGAGSWSLSKRTPLLGARVSVLCPGSRSGLGEFDGGVGAQIPVVEPLLGVGEIGAGTIVLGILWPGLSQVFGCLVDAVRMVMSEVVLGPRLCWSPGFELPAFWGLHRQ